MKGLILGNYFGTNVINISYVGTAKVVRLKASAFKNILEHLYVAEWGGSKFSTFFSFDLQDSSFNYPKELGGILGKY